MTESKPDPELDGCATVGCFHIAIAFVILMVGGATALRILFWGW